jgi:D-cysteine desulfhydrase/L-cysteate sulfo-lyase
MNSTDKPDSALRNFPRVALAHTPTPLEFMPNLSGIYDGYSLYVKRDDCTGLGFGGNKVRQIEFYLGDALAKGCDTVLSTGAIQSNYMRTIAAAASKLGLECHIQLEDRVRNSSVEYQTSGNRLLTGMFGATIHHYPHGEDEHGADLEIRRIADELKRQGKNPYVIPLAPTNHPRGALGYVVAAQEMIRQFEEQNLDPDLVVVGSGSGLTHSGLLFGLRLFGSDVPVLGACVRRSKELQFPRIKAHCENLSAMLDLPAVVKDEDIRVDDGALAPGYGQMSDILNRAIHMAATCEGLLVDPVYSGKTLACIINLIESGSLTENKNIVFVHTGGTPAIFAYKNEIEGFAS